MHLLHVVAEVVAVFVVPLVAIALFILADQAMIWLARYFVTSPKPRKADNKMCTDLKVLPSNSSSSAGASPCPRAATCKHAGRPGGCAALRQAKLDARATRTADVDAGVAASSSETSNQDK
jgi:hypothetical protein